MIEIVQIEPEHTLADYEAEAELRQSVQAMEDAADKIARRLRGRTIWMVNSTASGGGVAEMMPSLVGTLRDLGVKTQWAVFHVDEPEFFRLTKRLHNMLHGSGHPDLSEDDHHLYERVSRKIADGLREHIQPGDILGIHDPQPLAAGAMVAREAHVPSIWRCHIGNEEMTPTVHAAWEFLKPWARRYDRVIFTLPEYVPEYLQDRVVISPPAIDPLSLKNRLLSVTEVARVLARAGLVKPHGPIPANPFEHGARRLQPDGSLGPATEPEDIDLLFRPIVLQVSRWDRLKGWTPLMQGFARMKKQAGRNGHAGDGLRSLELARLVLAGPEPETVKDDPEGQEAFEELCGAWRKLDPEIQRDIAILVLPANHQDNALTVNALQRVATIVAQNSLREGFGLTVTEAMWKRSVIIGTHAAGIRAQIREGEDGLLTANPNDPTAVAATLEAALSQPECWREWSRNAQRRVVDSYLIFTQIQRWLGMVATLVD